MTAEAKLKISLDGVEVATAKLKQFAQAAGAGLVDAGRKASGAVAGLKSGLMSVRGALAAAGAYKFGAFVVGSIKMADAADKATNAYVRMGGTRDGLARLSASLGGVVGGSDLASAGVEAMRANTGLTGAQFEIMAKFAKQAADATGGDFAGALGEVNAAMITGRPTMLRRLGLHVDTEKAVKDAAHAQNKLVAAMSDEAKHGAIANAVLAEMKKRLDGMPAGAKTAGDALSEFGKNWGELKEHMGRGFGEMLGPVFRGINDVAAGRKGVSGAVSGVLEDAGQLAKDIGLTKTGRAITPGGAIRMPGAPTSAEIAAKFNVPSIKVAKIVTRQAGGE